MATITVIQPSIMTETVKRRVAAYCRVSSSSEDQLGSYQAQLTYYSHKFEDSNTEELVDLYADEGITGTRDDKRDEFQRLMKDCRRGKIDRIYTKSISRFARNTKDCLKNLRELKSLGITVFFEKENIDTANMTDEIMITILGGLAQEESVSISQNTKWAIRKKMASGTYNAPHLPYGYYRKDGEIQVDDSLKEVIKKIFSDYLNGEGMTAIANELNLKEIEPPIGKRWYMSTIRYILTNERYIGDALFQKKYSTDTFPFEKKRNKGELDQYYIQGILPQIIPENIFNKVNCLISERKDKASTNCTNTYTYTSVIKCKLCGCSYRRKNYNGQIYWVCKTHNEKAANCNSIPLSEKQINEAFIKVFNKLLHHYKTILITTYNLLQELKCKKYGGNVRVMDIHKEIAKLREQNHVIARLRTKGFMDEGKFQEQSKELKNKIRKLQAELKKLTRSDDEDDILDQLDMLTDYFEKREHMMISFEPETFDSMVDKTTANQNELTFHLLGGIELKEKI